MTREIVGCGYFKVVSNMADALDEEAHRGPKEPPPMAKQALGNESREVVQWMYCFRDAPSRREALMEAQDKATAVQLRFGPPGPAARIVEWRQTLRGGGRLDRIGCLALAS